MNVKVPRALLENAGACSAGVSVFNSMVGEAPVSDVEWTPLHTLLLLVYEPDSLNWLRMRRLIPPPNFDGANLSYIELPGIDLRYISFAGADLSHANLAGAILNRANLMGASLEGASLEGTDLTGAYYDGPLPDGWGRDKTNRLHKKELKPW